MVKKFTIPFASQGDANDIPDALQVDGKVSFTQGFGYDYERPYDDPQAKDIAREDMNGIFKAITSAVGELQTLGASEWSSAIAYPKGAIVYFEKDLYISQADDNQSTPPQNWTSIKNIADDSLKKAMNLADLTNKATARDNLGLGSSATLNKTDVLGTSTSLVATQKLVNDTKINLENSKQDKLTFVGNGPEVMKMGAFGLGFTSFYAFEAVDNISSTEFTVISKNATDSEDVIALTLANAGSGAGKKVYYTGFGGSTNRPVWGVQDASNKTSYFFYYTQENTSVDYSGFLRVSGNKEAFTKDLVTQSTGSSTTSVMSQKAVTDRILLESTPIGTIQAFIGENAPNDKWLLCRGQAFSAENYPDLAQLLPDLKIPDLRGVALRGLDANRGFDPNRKLLSYQEDAMQKITGEFARGGIQGYSDISGVFSVVSNHDGVHFTNVSTEWGALIKFDSSLDTRTNTQNETVMKNVAVNFIIKAR